LLYHHVRLTLYDRRHQVEPIKLGKRHHAVFPEEAKAIEAEDKAANKGKKKRRKG
jgi:hypothetical protein